MLCVGISAAAALVRGLLPPLVFLSRDDRIRVHLQIIRKVFQRSCRRREAFNHCRNACRVFPDHQVKRLRRAADILRAITGEALEIEENRGKLFHLIDGQKVMVTYHPAFILRTPDKAIKQLRTHSQMTATKAMAWF